MLKWHLACLENTSGQCDSFASVTAKIWAHKRIATDVSKAALEFEI